MEMEVSRVRMALGF